MMFERLNPMDMPPEPCATCPECSYRCDHKKACDLAGVCPECGEILENDNA